MITVANKKYSLKPTGTGEYELFTTGAGEEFDGLLYVTNHSSSSIYYAYVGISDGGGASDDEWILDYQKIAPKGSDGSVLKIQLTIPASHSVRVKTSTATTLGFLAMGKLTTTT